MRRLSLWVFVLLAVVVAGLGYVRLAPSDPAQWHTLPETLENKDFDGGVMRVADAGPDGLARLDAIARATPRTKLLAGSVQSGMITYVTRTKTIGFPDYTTVRQDGDQLAIWARLRFGESDFGVNRTRVETWLDALQAR